MNHPIDRWAVERRVTRVLDYYDKQFNRKDREYWTVWREGLLEIQKDSKKEPRVVIALLGGTGAGKSTLINALIGKDIIPTNDMKSCTSAVTELAFKDSPGNSSLSAEIEFLSKEDWESEKEDLLGDYLDSDGDGDCEISLHAVAKLWGVYKASNEQKLTEFKSLLKKSTLIEPKEISLAFREKTRKFDSTDAKEFKKELSYYLDSEHRFWPIVKRVRVTGPFESLRDGTVLVDLPGINDPNESREAVTRLYLKTSRFLWIVCDSNRGIGSDLWEFITEAAFTRRLVLDGHEDSLTFIATKCDAPDPDMLAEEYGLPSDTPIPEIFSHRNRLVRREIGTQCENLALHLESKANNDALFVKHIAEAIRKSAIFTLSTSEYLRLRKISRRSDRGLTDESQTQIPQLIDHLGNISAGYGEEVYSQMINHRIEAVIEEIKAYKNQEKGNLVAQKEIAESKRKEVSEAAESADNFLKCRVSDSRAGFQGRLTREQDFLYNKINEVAQRLVQNISHVVSTWSNLHWATLRATVRRGGRFVRKTQVFDFSEDLCGPLLEGIQFAWAEYFGNRLKNTVEEASQDLLRKAEEERNNLILRITEILGSFSSIPDNLRKRNQATERLLQELVNRSQSTISNKIEAERRTLYERIPATVHREMQPAYAKAAQEQGKGMKDRMIMILSRHARETAETMFDMAREALLEGIRALNNSLTKEYDVMADAVLHHSEVSLSNWKTFSTNISTGEIDKRIKAIDEMLAGMREL